MTYYLAKYLSSEYGYYIDTGIKFKSYNEAKEYLEKNYGRFRSNQITEIHEKRVIKIPEEEE